MPKACPNDNPVAALSALPSITNPRRETDPMVPSSRNSDPPEPAVYTLRMTEGIWELAAPRGAKGKPVKVASWFNLPDALEGSKRIAASQSHGAVLTILTVVNFKTCRQRLEFPPTAEKP
jgi:hypothetical protein